MKLLSRVRLLALTRLFCPWDFPGNSTGVDCHFLLQRIFPTQGWNPGLPQRRQTLYCLSHQGSLGTKVRGREIRRKGLQRSIRKSLRDRNIYIYLSKFIKLHPLFFFLRFKMFYF